MGEIWGVCCEDFSTAVTQALYKSELELTKDTPYLTLKGEIWGVFCEYNFKGQDMRCLLWVQA